jgi:hypothetical protein
MQFASLVPLTYGPVSHLQHGYYATNYFNRENFCISPTQCSYFFQDDSSNIHYFSKNNNQLVSVMQMRFVYYAVMAVFLNKI